VPGATQDARRHSQSRRGGKRPARGPFDPIRHGSFLLPRPYAAAIELMLQFCCSKILKQVTIESGDRHVTQGEERRLPAKCLDPESLSIFWWKHEEGRVERCRY
jgi:hypothetical protein